MTDLNITIKEIDDARKRHGVSVVEFCRRAGIHKATWYRWLAGNSPRDDWERIVRAAPGNGKGE